MPTRLRDRESILLLILIIIHLIPLWGFKYFPSQDGPVHLENAVIIRELNHPDHTMFQEYYEFNKQPQPNWLMHLILAGLTGLVPITIAEKILLTGYIILLPLAIRYALRTIRPEAGFLAVLTFPFIYSVHLHMGFYYFSYSLVVFFLVIGYWIKHRDDFGLRSTVTLGLLWLLLYLSHIVSLGVALAGVAILAIALTVADLVRQVCQDRFDVRVLGRSVLTRGLLPAVSALPTLTLVWMFLSDAGTKRSGPLPAGRVAKELLTLESLVSYENREAWFSIALACLFLAVLLYLLISRAIRREGNRWDVILVVTAAFVVLCFKAPNKISGGAYITPRLMLYPFFMLILWFGAHSYPKKIARTISAAAIVISLGLVGLHCVKYAELNDYLEEYLSVTDWIEPNTTLMPLSYSHKGYSPEGRALSTKVSPFLHTAGYIAAEKRLVEFTNYEAKKPLFPIMFTLQHNPYAMIGLLEGEPPYLHFPRLFLRTDYILVWGVRDEHMDDESTQKVLRILTEYDRLYKSDRELVRLYRRRNWVGQP